MIIAIPEVLREVLGPDGARALAEVLNEASVQTRGDVIEIAATRFERRLTEEIGELRAELGLGIGGLRGDFDAKIGGLRGDLDAKIGGLRGDLDAKIAAVRGDLDSKIAELRGDLEGRMGAFEARIIRWMFVFWISQIGMLAGILFALLRT